jgi:hypothetical protein
MATTRSRNATPTAYCSSSIQLLYFHHVEMRGGLHRRASGDCVVLCLVGASGLAGSFCDVLWDRLRGSAELIDDVAMAFRDTKEQSACEDQEFNRALVHIELLEAEHDRLIDTGALRGCVTAVNGLDHDHGSVPVHVHGHGHGVDHVDGNDHVDDHGLDA